MNKLIIGLRYMFINIILDFAGFFIISYYNFNNVKDEKVTKLEYFFINYIFDIILSGCDHFEMV